ncbi:hypothetical protein ACJZ2D_016168 [Fusarium nematophilum]
MTDYTPNIYAGIAVTLPLATASLVLRLLARRMTKASYALDDVLAVISYFISVGFTSVVLVWAVNFGLGRTLADGPRDITEEQRLVRSRLMLWLTCLVYTFAIASAKFTILAFYWRIFKFSGIRIPIQVLTGITVSWFIVRVCFITMNCLPTNAFWDHSISEKACRINEATFFFTTVLTHVLIDWAILALPVIEVGRLHLPIGQKIAVIAMFMFGAVVCLASIFLLIQAFQLDPTTKEIGLDMGLHENWATVEVNLAVVAASLPMLRPIFQKILPRAFLTSHRGNQSGQTPQSSNPYGHRSTLSKNKSIKLDPVAKRNDGSSSTHELADPEASPSDFEQDRPDWGRGTDTVNSGPWRKYASSRDVDDYDQSIDVQNETAVKVDQRV